MKINPDCLRKILLTVESLPPDHESLGLVVFPYSEEEVFDHVKYLSDEGLIVASFVFCDGRCIYNVSGLTPAGADYLEELRENKAKRFIRKNGKAILSFLLDHLLPFLK